MIKIVIIDEVMAVNTKRVTNRVTNLEEDFRTMGVAFSEGADSFYGEAVQRDIDPIVELAKDGLIQKQPCWIDFTCVHRTVRGKEGDFHKNEIRVKRIIPLKGLKGVNSDT